MTDAALPDPRLKGQVDVLIQAAKRAPPETFGISAGDLDKKVFPPVPWIVPEVIPQGVTILAGRPKLGKSWLALDIAIGVAAGRKVLGQEAPEQGDVLYLALEDNERRLQERLRRLCPFTIPDRLTFATEWHRAKAGGVAKLERWAKSVRNPRLVVIDVLAGFRDDASEKKTLYTNDYEAVAHVREFANATGVAVIIVHHTRKGESSDPLELISGTLGLVGAADTTFVLDRKPDVGFRLVGRGRDVAEIDLAMSFDKDSCRFAVKGDTVEVRRSDERSRILDAVRTHGPMRPAGIAAATDMKPGNVRRLLQKLARDGDLMILKDGSYAIPGNSGNSGNASPICPPGNSGNSGNGSRLDDPPEPWRRE